MTIYFTSDLHLGHASIVGMNARPFRDVDKMNAALIRNINNRVSLTDTLWILGDISYKLNREDASKLIQQINCNDIRLVKGNHDKEWDGYGLFREICDYKEFKIDGRRVCLMHYPIASWNGMHRGSVHLHGHSHNTFDYNVWNVMNERLIWDVGVDANGYEPISWDEICRELGVGIEHDAAWHESKQRAWEMARVPGANYPLPSHHETYGASFIEP